MSKKKPGLPENFAFEPVVSVQPSAPAELTSYLDNEMPERPPSPRIARPAPSPEPQVVPPSKTKSPAKRSRPPRKELTLDAESIKKVTVVRDDIRTQGPQPDASASEVGRALIMLAHDSRLKTNFSNLSPRGQYGSTTARAFVAGIKEALLKAVGRQYIERFPDEAARILEEVNLSAQPQEELMVMGE